MPLPNGQGSQLWWGQRRIGKLRRVRAGQSAGSTFDCTSMASPVVGSGANARVCQQLDAPSIAPAKVAVEFFGASPFALADVGRVDAFVYQSNGGVLSGFAILQDFEMESAVGEKLAGTATFQFTGF